MSSNYEAVKAWRHNPEKRELRVGQAKRSRNSGSWKKWEKKNRRRRRLKKDYGLTPEGFQDLLSKQGGKCIICLQEFSSNQPCVDHCHQTGKVRGLLCRPCNLILGAAKDSVSTLVRAVSYLQESGLVDTGP